MLVTCYRNSIIREMQVGFRALIRPILEKMDGAKSEESSLFGVDGFLAPEQGRNTEETIYSLIAEEIMILLLWK